MTKILTLKATLNKVIILLCHTEGHIKEKLSLGHADLCVAIRDIIRDVENKLVDDKRRPPSGGASMGGYRVTWNKPRHPVGLGFRSLEKLGFRVNLGLGFKVYYS